MKLTVEDYFDGVTNEKKIERKVIFSDNANIITREVKETRNTIEEITEKEYKDKIKKAHNKKAKTVSFKEVEKE
jgi:hypothetical protein|tara:strand:+ start:254 stop:475 length:222 start_codon:yes stop_codon:yes gene_type:complete